MYTDLKNIQVIISLLKQYGISKLVLSPGTRNVPLVHSVEQDSFFNCYSVVDERSAAYFAIGLAEAYNEVVCVSCTSSTATCNYMPAVMEAKRRGIRILLLTADRDNYFLKQGEDQLIPQNCMYGNYVNTAVNMPIVNNNHTLKYCIRKCNEALLAVTNRHSGGPVQINFQVNSIDLCKEEVLPEFRRVEVVEDSDISKINEKKLELKNANRIMVVLGQSNVNEKNRIEELLDTFFEKYNCMITFEETSNINPKNGLKTCLITEAMTQNEFDKYCPDLVITLGGHIFSYLKYKLRSNYERINHWRVTTQNDYLDNYDALTTVFNMTEIDFLTRMNDVEGKSDSVYHDMWARRISEVVFPELGFTNSYIIKQLCEILPTNSLVHLSILNSVRLFNFFYKGNAATFSNLGADGIDGCFPTFLGEAENFDGLAFLITGDLSFLYALNNITLKHNNNIRILVINNHAGGEFHNNFGVEKISTLRNYISAAHSTDIGAVISMSDFVYKCAHNEQELDEAYCDFVKATGKPMILEVFTDADLEASVIKKFYAINQRISIKDKIKGKYKAILKRIIK